MYICGTGLSVPWILLRLCCLATWIDNPALCIFFRIPNCYLHTLKKWFEVFHSFIVSSSIHIHFYKTAFLTFFVFFSYPQQQPPTSFLFYSFQSLDLCFHIIITWWHAPSNSLDISPFFSLTFHLNVDWENILNVFCTFKALKFSSNLLSFSSTTVGYPVRELLHYTFSILCPYGSRADLTDYMSAKAMFSFFVSLLTNEFK